MWGPILRRIAPESRHPHTTGTPSFEHDILVDTHHTTILCCLQSLLEEIQNSFSLISLKAAISLAMIRRRLLETWKEH
jgi:hypothetical protein